MPFGHPPPSFRFFAVVILTVAAATASSAPRRDTKAVSTLTAWLAVFNSGSSASIEEFGKDHAPWMVLDQAMDLRSRTGGYDLVRIEQSGDLWAVFRVKEKSTQQEVIGRLVLDSSNPVVISKLGLQSAAGATGPALDAAERARVVGTAADRFNEYYVFPDVAKATAAALRANEERGAYRGITDGEVLAVRLSDDLRTASRDKHVSVRFSSQTVPPDEAARRADTLPGRREHLAVSNCGFVKAEHLSPNVGYLKLDEFGEASICAPTAIAAMNFVAESDALIIDLRDNHGGAPDMVALLCSYLFAEPTHLDDLFDRETRTTQQSWTSPHVAGKSFAGKPVYVLVSRHTFSAAEEFAYDLKALKRATLIGETTGGGAHSVAPHRLGDHFFIAVPFGRFINPITHTDWEGTGVEPDVKVAASDAFTEAVARARGSAVNHPGA